MQPPWVGGGEPTVRPSDGAHKRCDAPTTVASKAGVRKPHARGQTPSVRDAGQQGSIAAFGGYRPPGIADTSAAIHGGCCTKPLSRDAPAASVASSSRAREALAFR